MKKPPLLLLAFISCPIFAQQPAVQTPDFDSAVKLLSTSRPVSGDVVAILPDSEKKAELKKLFSEEMAAIDVIQKSHREVNLAVLFPYIRISSQPDPRLGYIHLTRPQEDPTANMDAKRAQWPVFALILDMPNAAQSLEKYGLNSGNPMNYRLDAYQILSYLDKDRLKNVAAKLRIDAPGNPKYIDAIEQGKWEGFSGG